jgi:hypothetical protein
LVLALKEGVCIAGDLYKSDPLLEVVLVCFLVSLYLPLKALLIFAPLLQVLYIKRLLNLAVKLV